MNAPLLPRLVLPNLQRQALHGAAASRAIEARALAAAPPHALMRRAGDAVARLALALAPHAQSFWIAAGPGNNGGDGLEAAVQLTVAGKNAGVLLLGDGDKLPADARHALQRAQDAGVRLSPQLPSHADAELLIDALLGLGSNRAPEGALASAIALLNAASAPVLAIDLPSGLDADTGQPHGDLAVQASHTLSLLTLKPGLFTAQGRDHAGVIWLDCLGRIDDPAPDAWLAAAQDWRDAHPSRRHGQHKGSFGDVLVVGGATGMSGAALLAASAALRAGAGRVYLDALDPDMPLSSDPSLMLRPGRTRDDPSSWASDTVVCGCGGGTAIEDVLPAVLEHSARLVLDADALNAVARSAALQALLAGRATRQQATVLTPHPLEAARLLGSDTPAVQRDRLRAARTLAQRWHCTVLLKGSGTVCAAPERTPTINSTGNALLSSAGTGDVLAGWIGGLWSQQDPTPPAPGTALRVATASAWLHGRAAGDAAAAHRVTPIPSSSLAEAMADAAARLPR